jgi:hypothetical protein
MSATVLEKTEPQERAIEALLQGFNLRGTKALRILRRVAERVGDSSSEEEAFERVRIRSIGVDEDILAEEGGAVSDAAFAKLIGVNSRQTVHNYREAGRLFAIPRGERNLLYPVWQVHKDKLLPGLSETLKVLRAKNTPPYGIALFFLTPAEALAGKSPLDLLRRNEVPEVVLHAHRYGVIGS